jgi:hypothetical protein
MGCVRSKAWIWLFSSTLSTIAWSIQVETDDVTNFGHELGVGAEFEGLHAMGLEMMFLPDALYGWTVDAGLSSPYAAFLCFFLHRNHRRFWAAAIRARDFADILRRL